MTHLWTSFLKSLNRCSSISTGWRKMRLWSVACVECLSLTRLNHVIHQVKRRDPATFLAARRSFSPCSWEVQTHILSRKPLLSVCVFQRGWDTRRIATWFMPQDVVRGASSKTWHCRWELPQGSCHGCKAYFQLPLAGWIGPDLSLKNSALANCYNLHLMIFWC